MSRVAAKGRQMQGATTKAYKQYAIRRGGATPQMAAFCCPLKSRSDFGDLVPEMLRISRGNPTLVLNLRSWADALSREAKLVLRPFDSRHGLWPWARSGFRPTGELGGATGSARGTPLRSVLALSEAKGRVEGLVVTIPLIPKVIPPPRALRGWHLSPARPR